LYFPTNKQQTTMNFEIQALGGKLIGSRSAMKTLDRLTTLLPNAKINFEVIPPVTEKVEFGSMPNFRDPVSDEDEDEDDIMHDPDIQEMVKNGEHTCHMFDAHCQACEDDEEEEEEEEEEDDITLAELKEQLEDNMTLAEIQKRLLEEEEESLPKWSDEMTYYSNTSGHLPNF